VVRGVLLSLGVVRPADYSRRVATSSVETSDAQATSGALHRDDKAFQALQLHFGSLSCVNVMESSGNYSTFDEAETRVVSTKPLPEMILAIIMFVAMMRVSATRSTII